MFRKKKVLKNILGFHDKSTNGTREILVAKIWKLKTQDSSLLDKEYEYEQCKKSSLLQVKQVFAENTQEDPDDYSQDQLCYILKRNMVLNDAQKNIDRERIDNSIIEPAYYNKLICNGAKGIKKRKLALEFISYFRNEFVSQNVNQVLKDVMSSYTKTQLCYIMSKPLVVRELLTPQEAQYKLDKYYKSQDEQMEQANQSLEQLSTFKPFIISGHGVINKKQPMTILPPHVILVMIVSPGCSLVAVKKTERLLWKTFGELPFYFQNLLLSDPNIFPEDFYFKNNLFFIGNSCIPNICIDFSGGDIRSGIFSHNQVKKYSYDTKTSTKGTLFKSFVNREKSKFHKNPGCEGLSTINDVINYMDLFDEKANKLIILQTCANLFSETDREHGNVIIDYSEKCSTMSSNLFQNYFTRFPIQHTPQMIIDSLDNSLLLKEIFSFRDMIEDEYSNSRGIARKKDIPWTIRFYNKVRHSMGFYTEQELRERDMKILGLTPSEYNNQRWTREKKLEIDRKYGFNSIIQEVRTMHGI
jgi:hypothetical protein